MSARASILTPSGDAVRLVDTLEAAGVTLALQPDGAVSFRAPSPIAASTLAEARRLRSDIALVLRARLCPADPPAPQSAKAPRRVDAPASLRNAPSWSDAAIEPQLGDRCRCCGGRTWWTKAEDPRGWCCATCHPPLRGLGAVRIAPIEQAAAPSLEVAHQASAPHTSAEIMP